MKTDTLEPKSVSGLGAPELVCPAGDYALPSVTVVVPCRNEEKHIGNCLESILANDYPVELLEILVVDGASEDGTREIVRGYAERFPYIALVDNPKKHIPGAMNLGIKNARGETVIKMDAHSTYQRNHISLCVAYQEKCGAENVGGACKMTPGADTPMAKAIVLGLAHRFGSGNANVKVGVEKPTWSDTTAFGCFKKELFGRVGPFDERLLSSSDIDMNKRIQAAGGRVLVLPDVKINYVADANVRALGKHVFADGVWISYALKFGKRAWSWRHWVPAALVLSLIVMFGLAGENRRFLWLGSVVAGVYVAANLVASFQVALRERDLRYAFLLPLVFAVRHLVHGVGTLYGLLLVIVPGDHWKSRRGRKA